MRPCISSAHGVETTRQSDESRSHDSIRLGLDLVPMSRCRDFRRGHVDALRCSARLEAGMGTARHPHRCVRSWNAMPCPPHGMGPEPAGHMHESMGWSNTRRSRAACASYSLVYTKLASTATVLARAHAAARRPQLV